MTYCVGVRVAAGLVLLSDTRTNAGVDNISRFGKMFTWTTPGERAICMMCFVSDTAIVNPSLRLTCSMT